MKTIGILGGLGPESTVEYYKGIIRTFRTKKSGYPRIIIYSADLDEFWKIIKGERNDELIVWLAEKIESLHDAGADFAVISSNTPHVVFDDVNSRSLIPLLSIVEETCKKAKSMNLKKCGLFGTGFTMRSGFYRDYFSKYNISIAIPDDDDRKFLDEKISSELAFGIIKDKTRSRFLQIAKGMIDEQSIDSVLLACTELPLILSNDSEYGIPFLSTTAIHVESIVKYCLSK